MKGKLQLENLMCQMITLSNQAQGIGHSVGLSLSFLKNAWRKKKTTKLSCAVFLKQISLVLDPPHTHTHTAIFIQSCSESWPTEASSHSVPATSLEVCALKDQIHNQHSRRVYNPESPSSTGPSVSLLEPQKQARTPNGLKTYR